MRATLSTNLRTFCSGVTNSTLRHSAQLAVYLGLWAEANADLESSNTFSDNASGNVFREE